MTTSQGLARGVRQKGNKFWVKVPGAGGRELAFGDPDIAFKWLTDAKDARKRNEAMPPEPRSGSAAKRSAMSFAEYANHVWWPSYLERKNIAGTNRNTRKHLDMILEAPRWPRLAITSIRADDLTSWAEVIASSRWKSHPEKLFPIVFSVFEHARDDVDCAVIGNPAARIRPALSRLEKEQDIDLPRLVLNLAVVPSVVEEMRANSRLPLAMGLLGGMRAGEAFGAAVGSFTRSQPAGPASLVICRQRRGAPWSPQDTGGITTRLAPWTKTLAGRRTIDLAPTLADAIVEHIVRNYGHKPEDPWWDLPCADPWDPMIVLNRDLPIVCGPGGPSDAPGIVEYYRDELNRAAQRLGIDLRNDPADTRGPLTHHDLRKAFSTYLHDAGVDAITRSRYLGHAVKAADGGAKVTAATYTPETAVRRGEIPALTEDNIVPAAGRLIPPPAGTGEDELMTAREAADKLGRPLGQKQLEKLAAASDLQRHRSPWRRQGVWYYRLGDLRALADSVGSDAVYETRDVAARLFPDLSGVPQRHAVYEECKRGNITRARQGHYTRASVAALEERFAEIDRGLWLTREGFVAAVGANPEDCGASIFSCTRGDFVPAETVATAAADKPILHSLGAQALGLDEHTYWSVLRAFDLTWAQSLADSDRHTIPGRRLAQVRRDLDQLAARCTPWTLRPLADDAGWISAAAAATAIGCSSQELLDRAMRRGDPAGVKCGELYLRREHLHIDEAGAPTATIDILAERLGMSTARAAALADQYGWCSPRNADVLRIDRVKTTLVELMSGDRPLINTVSEAAVLAGVSVATVRRRLNEGDGVREFARPPASWVTARNSAKPVLLVFVPYEDALPSEYVTLRTAATECNVAESTVNQWAKRVGAPTAVMRHGRWFVDINHARVRFTVTVPTGWVEFSELTANTPFASRSVRNRLVQLVGRGLVRGVKIAGHPTRWYFPPELRRELRELFPGRSPEPDCALPIAG